MSETTVVVEYRTQGSDETREIRLQIPSQPIDSVQHLALGLVPHGATVVAERRE